MITLLIVLAGLMGTGGVVLAAAAAHIALAPGSGLEGANVYSALNLARSPG